MAKNAGPEGPKQGPYTEGYDPKVWESYKEVFDIENVDTDDWTNRNHS